MAICETCGKKLKWGEDYTRNGITQCSECANKEAEQKLALKKETLNIEPITANTELTEKNTKRNSIATALDIIGTIILVLGIIGSLIIWAVVADNINGTVGFIAFILELLSSVTFGLVLRGLGEIINLLQKNVDILKNSSNKDK